VDPGQKWGPNKNHPPWFEVCHTPTCSKDATTGETKLNYGCNMKWKFGRLFNLDEYLNSLDYPELAALQKLYPSRRARWGELIFTRLVLWGETWGCDYLLNTSLIVDDYRYLNDRNMLPEDDKSAQGYSVLWNEMDKENAPSERIRHLRMKQRIGKCIYSIATY